MQIPDHDVRPRLRTIRRGGVTDRFHGMAIHVKDMAEALSEPGKRLLQMGMVGPVMVVQPCRGLGNGQAAFVDHVAGTDQVLTSEALAFVADLARTFSPRIEALLEARRQRQRRLDRGERLAFNPQTAEVREGDWKVAPHTR